MSEPTKPTGHSNAKMNRILSVVMLSALVFTACRQSPEYYGDFRFIDPVGWTYGDTLTFIPEINDSIATGTLSIALRHTNEYLYSNIWVETITSDSLSSRTDTLDITLADEFGHWLGRGIGTDFQTTDTIAASITLRPPVTVKVRHIMRTDMLEGIEQVGIVFHETH